MAENGPKQLGTPTEIQQQSFKDDTIGSLGAGAVFGGASWLFWGENAGLEVGVLTTTFLLGATLTSSSEHELTRTDPLKRPLKSILFSAERALASGAITSAIGYGVGHGVSAFIGGNTEYGISLAMVAGSLTFSTTLLDSMPTIAKALRELKTRLNTPSKSE